MRLTELLERWLGRVEVTLTGSDLDLREGRDACARNEYMRARLAAKRIVERTPDSLLGLALLADACEGAALHAELVQTLEYLALRIPTNANVWLRLGRARSEVGDDVSLIHDAFVRALTVADYGSDERRAAIFELADIDLARGDGARAELWLARLPIADPAVRIANAEAQLLLGNTERAGRWLSDLTPDPTDGRAARVVGTYLAQKRDHDCYIYLVRAVLLDEPTALDVLRQTIIWHPPNDSDLARVITVVSAKAVETDPRWRSALAYARGLDSEAVTALMEAVDHGDADSAIALFEMALRTKNHEALAKALPLVPASARSEQAKRLLGAIDAASVDRSLDLIATVILDDFESWTQAITAQRMSEIAPPPPATVQWDIVLERCMRHAKASGLLRSMTELFAIERERERPVLAVIAGEFNAGKSTWINAWLGADVAPTGILPTTATLHHLRFGPDPYARIVHRPVKGIPDRILAQGALREVLAGLCSEDVERVELIAPVTALTRVELLDTPGFNALDHEHAQAAERGLTEADVVLYLLDASQALKHSDREVLARIAAAGIPVQIFVTKIDRFNAENQKRILHTVSAGLADAGLGSITPPIAVSAKLALKAKLEGVTDDRSGWCEVETFIEEQLLSRSAARKDGSLRRRALRAVLELRDQFERASQVEQEQRRTEVARHEGRLERAAAMERDEKETNARMKQALAPAFRTWQQECDLAKLALGRSRNGNPPHANSFLVSRALVWILPALLEGWQRIAQPAELLEASLRAAALALVRAFAMGDTHALETLSESAMFTLVDLLREVPASTEHGTTAKGLLRETRALANALDFSHFERP